ncbi:pentatricopeptide repeat-containing protein At4g02750-like isoform X2 [Zingiber officinale]|uniref:pentatricopeptide repeat-containing protein At4g02750-like isoform X2 n=1 Tax=Zingiber officinale TaxID=94328 RepID=UPI001C4CECA2|nr:pentatricopeptide repeat-containing protein At4g02750-like isoform X2 [Zingiber officinale]
MSKEHAASPSGVMGSMVSRSGRPCDIARRLLRRSNATWSLTVSQTKSITAHGKSGDVDKALELFDQMPHRNLVAYNAMLSVLIDSGRLDSSLQFFSRMPLKNSRSYTSMITGMGRSGRVREARRLFDSIPSRHRNVFAWTAMICCYAQNDEPLRAVKLFTDSYGDFSQSKNALVDAYAKLGCLIDAERVFGRMKWKDLASWNTMMDCYTHNLLLHQAFEIFNSMKDKDILSWNIMMSGLLESRRGLEVPNLFLSLSRLYPESKPNSSTYSIVLSACATHAMLEFGRQIHSCSYKISLYPYNIFVSNALVTMYANCGLMKEMVEVFDELPNKDVVSWNSVIQGFGQNGEAREALNLAKKALDSGMFNANTFTAIFTSCSHGGLVIEGLDYFNSMRRKYGIEPNLDHYVCVVDLLGRAGMVKEANDLLGSMPFPANSVAWSTLLNACSLHGSVDIGRVAARKLQMMEPGSVKSYLALASAYNRTGNEGASSKLLDPIVENHTVKEHGSSWVIKM